MSRGSRLRQTGWFVLLTLCGVVFLVLTFHVNSVKNKVHLAERKIIALERAQQTLEIEFEARANQQQLADWNKIDFGYQTPRADQYLDNPRQLAALGLARDPDAPAPIRVARGGDDTDQTFVSMVSSVTGKPASRPFGKGRPGDLGSGVSAGITLADQLSRSSGLGGQIADQFAEASE